MLSIVVPVYNKEKYIEDCVNSIIAQEYKDFELILIDDGSTDSSYEIMKKYEEYKNIHIYHKKNGGVSSARNLGISKATGDKIVFIDADDYISSDYLITLSKYNSFDFVLSGFQKNEKSFFPKKYSIKKENNDSFSFINELIKKENILYSKTPWAKLYNLNIIKENNIKFDEKMNFGEDYLFVLNYAKYIKSMIFIEYSGYNVVDVTGSLSKRKMNNAEIQLGNIFEFVKNEHVDKVELSYFFLFCIKTVMYCDRLNNYSKFKLDINYMLSLYDINECYKISKSIFDKIRIKLIQKKMYIFIYLIYKFL